MDDAVVQLNSLMLFLQTELHEELSALLLCGGWFKEQFHTFHIVYYVVLYP